MTSKNDTTSETMPRKPKVRLRRGLTGEQKEAFIAAINRRLNDTGMTALKLCELANVPPHTYYVCTTQPRHFQHTHAMAIADYFLSQDEARTGPHSYASEEMAIVQSILAKDVKPVESIIDTTRITQFIEATNKLPSRIPDAKIAIAVRKARVHLLKATTLQVAEAIGGVSRTAYTEFETGHPMKRDKIDRIPTALSKLGKKLGVTIPTLDALVERTRDLPEVPIQRPDNQWPVKAQHHLQKSLIVG